MVGAAKLSTRTFLPLTFVLRFSSPLQPAPALTPSTATATATAAVGHKPFVRRTTSTHPNVQYLLYRSLSANSHTSTSTANANSHTRTKVPGRNALGMSELESVNDASNESDGSFQMVRRKGVCPACHGEGQRKVYHKKRKQKGSHSHIVSPCSTCQATGLVRNVTTNVTTKTDTDTDTDFHVAIVGGGIGGLSLALALQQRSIPVTVYEKDASFDERRQGYGLTMQQGAKALKSLGFVLTKEGGDKDENEDDYHPPQQFGIHSKRHLVFTPDGTLIGKWGLKVWGRPSTKQKDSNRQNAHIPRQELRRWLYQNLHPGTVRWGHKLLEYQEVNEKAVNENPTTETEQQQQQLQQPQPHGGYIDLSFQTNNDDDDADDETVRERANVLVGADGIFSTVRKLKLGDSVSPLRYLGCIVVLGIVPTPTGAILSKPESLGVDVDATVNVSFSELTDGETVFQTADGTTRLYCMPFAPDTTMWQLSFLIPEADAKALSQQGPEALKAVALDRCRSWHRPIPDLLSRTPTELVSGYPVYDRNGVLPIDQFRPVDSSHVTLLGDAAHPMSPFKGQGANQALIDAVSLARALMRCRRNDGTSQKDRIPDEIKTFEIAMLKRTSEKVKASAEAAKALHSDSVLTKGNVTRGNIAKTQNV